MNILFHRPTPWSSSINCSTKIYARLFAKRGHNVTYLQSNINLFHWILKKGYYRVWAEGSRFEAGIWVCAGRSLTPFSNRFPVVNSLLYKWTYRMCWPSLKSVIGGSGFSEPDVIWTTIPGSSVLKQMYPNSRLIFHSIDNYAAFNGQGINNVLKKDYERADNIFVIGDALKQEIMETHGVSSDKITNLGQGVDLDNYKNHLNPPSDLPQIDGPVAIWVGVLKKLDLEYLHNLLLVFQKKKGVVVLIGPISAEFEQLAEVFPQLILLGAKSAEEVPAYLLNADLGLMMYDRNKQEVYKGQHPLKLYEYAAAGLPIISTWHQEFETLIPPIYHLDDQTDMESLISAALNSGDEFRDQVREFARIHSWENCVNKAMDAIANGK